MRPNNRKADLAVEKIMKRHDAGPMRKTVNIKFVYGFVNGIWTSSVKVDLIQEKKIGMLQDKETGNHMVLESIIEQLSSNDYFGFKLFSLTSVEARLFALTNKGDSSNSLILSFREFFKIKSAFTEAISTLKNNPASKAVLILLLGIASLMQIDVGQSYLYKERLKIELRQIEGFLFSQNNDGVVKYIQDLSEHAMLGYVITILGLGIFQLSMKEREFLCQVFSMQNSTEQHAILIDKMLNTVLQLFKSFLLFEGFSDDRTLLDNSLRFLYRRIMEYLFTVRKDTPIDRCLSLLDYFLDDATDIQCVLLSKNAMKKKDLNDVKVQASTIYLLFLFKYNVYPIREIASSVSEQIKCLRLISSIQKNLELSSSGRGGSEDFNSSTGGEWNTAIFNWSVRSVKFSDELKLDRLNEIFDSMLRLLKIDQLFECLKESLLVDSSIDASLTILERFLALTGAEAIKEENQNTLIVNGVKVLNILSNSGQSERKKEISLKIIERLLETITSEDSLTTFDKEIKNSKLYINRAHPWIAVAWGLGSPNKTGTQIKIDELFSNKKSLLCAKPSTEIPDDTSQGTLPNNVIEMTWSPSRS